MAKKFGARKCSKYKVIHSAPSVNKTPVGSAVVPIPYPVTEELKVAASVSPNVNFNSNKVYTKISNSTKVVGDEAGTLGGVKSGTVSKQSDPIEYSPSVRANGNFVVREGDVQFMQNKNTIGKVTTTESGSGVAVNDEGQISGDTLPPDISIPAIASALAPVALKALNKPNKTTPVASSGSGSLGSQTGSPVLLDTAQLRYVTEELPLWGKMPLCLKRTYISSDEFSGIFGNHWRYGYEQEFKQIDKNLYRLYLNDGRKFDFKKENDDFVDIGDLGVEVVQHGSSHFVLYFFDGKVQTFIDEKLIYVQGANENFVSITHDRSKRIEKIFNSEGSYFNFFYNKKGLVKKVVDYMYRTWLYNYDAFNNLISVTNPKDATTYYFYTEYKNKNNNSSYLLTKVKNTFDETKLHVKYTKDAKVHSYTQGEESFTYTYTSNTMITKESNNGDITHYGLDENGLIKAIVYADGSKSKQTYDKATKTAIITDQGGNKTTKIFDDRNRVIKEIDQEDKETIYKYEGNNPQASSIIENDKETKYLYDKNANLIELHENDTVQKFEYDEKGNNTKIIDNQGNETKIQYDENSRPIVYTNASDQKTTIIYDTKNRTETITDAQNNVVVNKYDVLDNIIKTTQASNTILFKYDKANKLTRITDPMSNETSFVYDEYERIIKQEKADKSKKSFIYNSNNTIKSITHEDNTKTIYTYNKANEVTKVDYNGEIVEYSYDSLGNMLSASNQDSNINYLYNSNAKIISELQNEIELNKQYDDKTQSLVNLNFCEKNFSYQRNDKDNIQEIKTAFDTVKLEYDANQIITKRIYPNNQEESITYDKTYNTTKIQTASQTIDYKYNEVNQIINKNELEFTYDNLGRLIEAKDLESKEEDNILHSYSYDKAGNNILENSSYNQSNYQLEQNDTYIFEYDLRGNIKEKLNKYTKEKTLYNFNNQNLLKDVKIYSANGKVINHLEFKYDALNRRIQKTHNNKTYNYIYDGLNIVAILDENQDLLASILHDESIDAPLSITTYDTSHLCCDKYKALSEEEQFEVNKKRTNTYYYHRDHQNSIIALSNKDGEIIESITYDNTYGKILQHEKLIETYNPYAYTGREFDSYDLYYYRARYYDSTTQRFLSLDPIEFLSGDFNFYRYVGNEPTNYTDALGFAKCNQKKLEKKFNKAKGKLASKLKELDGLKKFAAKKAAKKVATLPLKAVPFLGWAMAAYDVYDLVNTGMDVADMVKEYNAAADATQEAGEKLAACKKANGKKKDGGKVKSLKQTKVKCFNKKQDKHSAKDYDKQLKDQEAGLNDMSADQYLKGREAFDGVGCKGEKATTDSSLKNRPKRNASEARTARAEHQKDLGKKYKRDNPNATSTEVANYAKAKMKTLAALHNPDMVAAGKDIITGFGDKGINSSIGSQWKDRVSDLDNAACKAKADGKGKDKMNAKLKRC